MKLYRRAKRGRDKQLTEDVGYTTTVGRSHTEGGGERLAPPKITIYIGELEDDDSFRLEMETQEAHDFASRILAHLAGSTVIAEWKKEQGAK